MSAALTLDQLWDSVPARSSVFDPAQLSTFPEGARRYLTHAIAPGTPLASAVRLRMHGEIKLKGWFPFSAEQVISWSQGMIWRANVRVNGLSIKGEDALLHGVGGMHWRLFGLIPIVNAAGPDITRSAAGRLNIESLWLPSVLLGDNLTWTEKNPLRPHASFQAHGESAEIDHLIDTTGKLEQISMPRWGNLDNSPPQYYPFGGFLDEEATFEGYTIPIKICVGWHFGPPRFVDQGEFFRAFITDATFR